MPTGNRTQTAYKQYLPDELKALLREFSLRTGVPMQVVVRRAIRAYLLASNVPLAPRQASLPGLANRPGAR